MLISHTLLSTHLWRYNLRNSWRTYNALWTCHSILIPGWLNILCILLYLIGTISQFGYILVDYFIAWFYSPVEINLLYTLNWCLSSVFRFPIHWAGSISLTHWFRSSSRLWSLSGLFGDELSSTHDFNPTIILCLLFSQYLNSNELIRYGLVEIKLLVYVIQCIFLHDLIYIPGNWGTSKQSAWFHPWSQLAICS